MRRITFALLLVVMSTAGAVSFAGAQTPTSDCLPPPGASTAILCYGWSGCPPGYIDRVGFKARQLLVRNSPLNPSSSYRTLCTAEAPASEPTDTPISSPSPSPTP